MGLTSKLTRKKLDALVAPYASSARTLEVGSHGEPSYGRFFSNKIGIDIQSGKGVDTVASVYEIPFPDDHFDIVLCMSVLEHLENPPKAIEEMRRVLKPSGKIIVSVPFLFPIHDAPGDYWRFTKFGLQSLFKNWEIETLQAESKNNEMFAIMLQRFGYQTKMRANAVLKMAVFLLAKILSVLPDITTKVFGDIRKKTYENEAFASSFFLVARKQ